jgi:hypothetical protein
MGQTAPPAAPAAAPAPQQKSGGSNCLKILGCGCLVLLILGAVAVFLVIKFRRHLLMWVPRTAAVAAIRHSDLPEEQKEGLVKQIDRVTDAYKAGEVELKQVGKVLEGLAKSPIIPMALIHLADVKYVQLSGLSEAEKKQGSLDLQRFGRGVVEKKISDEEIGAARDHIAVKKGENEWELKQKLTDDEVRAFLATVKGTADKHNIPNEPYKIDPVAEFKKVVDEALKKE